MSEFEWDEAKRVANVVKHNFDFRDAERVFAGPHREFDTTRPGEERKLATALLDGRWVTLVFTWRNTKRRIISMRRAREDERDVYRQLHR